MISADGILIHIRCDESRCVAAVLSDDDRTGIYIAPTLPEMWALLSTKVIKGVSECVSESSQ